MKYFYWVGPNNYNNNLTFSYSAVIDTKSADPPSPPEDEVIEFAEEPALEVVVAPVEEDGELARDS